jgi:hypothetical protein
MFLIFFLESQFSPSGSHTSETYDQVFSQGITKSDTTSGSCKDIQVIPKDSFDTCPTLENTIMDGWCMETQFFIRFLFHG